MPGVLDTPRAAIAVLEREPYWGPELQRQLGDEGVYVRACTRVDELAHVVEEWPQSAIVLDLDTAPAAVLMWLSKRLIRGDKRPVLALASQHTAGLEWMVREVGATSFHPHNDVVGGALVMQCRRLLRHVK